MAYAQHQSFYLRDKWISKGLRFVKKDRNFFHDKEAFEKIGLGKNMVQSLKFWLIATELVIEDKKNKSHVLSELGELVYEFDRLLIDNSTVGILHYHLVKNVENRATAFNWFFNIFNETIFSREELEDIFDLWVQKEEKKPISKKSLKRDIDCLVQLYTKDMNEYDPEDVIFSPLKKLNLLIDNKKTVSKSHPEIKDIGISALYYVLLCYATEQQLEFVSVDEIIHTEMLWGKVFNMTRGEIVEALNQLSIHPMHPITFIRTNNLDNVLLPKDITPLQFLQSEYAFKGGM